MSTTIPDRSLRRLPASAPIFAALGDETRLALVLRLTNGTALSIIQLTEGFTLTRQAITKHLRVLQDAGLVCGIRRGRENLFELKPEQLDEARCALETISLQWDRALSRLKSYVESRP